MTPGEIFEVAYRGRSPAARQRMAALGVDCRERLPLWGVLTVQVREDGTFELADQGQRVAVCPIAWADDGECWWDPIEDLVAFSTAEPRRWYSLRRQVSILGPDQAFRAETFGEPLRLHSAPLDWLRAGGVGSCIVDWQSVPRLALGAAPAIICDSPALAHQLRQRHEAARTPWRIEVDQPLGRAAA